VRPETYPAEPSIPGMSKLIHTIILPLPLNQGSVNCFLLQAGDGYILVDTGAPNARRVLSRKLGSLGCRPGDLKLTILTHGDFDHTGNAAYVRGVFGGRTAMHPADAPMAETGDMFANRNRSSAILRALIPRLIGFGKAERFTPDVLLEDGFSLDGYGLEARVIRLPGHSMGSIGILTSDGDLLCGDLLISSKKPALNALIDDRQAAQDSVARLHSLNIKMVYPGHGQPFTLDQLR
jgi:hydroxyacylglutathione hydrolase